MLLNGIRCDGYKQRGRDWYEFSLSGTTVQAAAALNGQALKLTQDDGETLVASFEGYRVGGVEESGESVRLSALRNLEPAAEEAIRAVEDNLTVLSGKVTAAEEKADEAVETASQAGTSPSVRAAAKMYVNACATLSNAQVADMRDLIEDFAQGAEYELGMVRRHSLYTLIDLAPDGIRVWHMPTGATDSFALGEKAHHPGADGPVYVSGRDGNTSEPGTDEWWTLAEE